MPDCNLIAGDCLEKMWELPANSVQMILCDLPYGTTDCKWDSVVPLDKLWSRYQRLLVKHGVIALTASQPFTSVLVKSNLPWFRCEWIWKKNAGSNFGLVKWYPMKEHESVLIFGDGPGTYNPVMQPRSEVGAAIAKRGFKSKAHDRNFVGKGGLTGVYEHKGQAESELRVPSSVQLFNRERGLHPTQKPVALMEYLIKTYTNEGDTVLDNCMGSGTTGVACMNLNRNFIGIEKDPKYFEIAKTRIDAVRKTNRPSPVTDEEKKPKDFLEGL